ncbi:MAG: outer membrane protein assembly factor BamA [Gammaproteobacteria bacterium]|nr:outer membrane protein assembly factor BamA [Gammaproteobacteria bacterium]
MRNCCNPLLILSLIILLGASSLIEAAQSFIVSDIRLEGLEKIPEGTLLNYLPVIQGDPLDDNQVIFAIKELYKTGFFADVQMLRDGDVLVVRVKERPSITEISFDGNSDIDDETLEEAMKGVGLAKGRIFNRSLLEKLTAELEAVYFSQGKYNVKIDAEVEELEQNRVNIDINISEGIKSLIKQINIIGNNVFDDETMLDEIQLGIPSAWAFLSDADDYSKPKLQADLETIRSYYLDRGYIKFNVDSTQVSITPDKKDIYVTINVSEGDKYTVGEVLLTGDMVINKAVLEQLISTKSGDTFSRRLMTESQKAIEDRVGMTGYAFAKVNVIPQINDEDRSISLTYNLEPGRKVYARRITFFGNYKTRDEVLRREMRLMEGSVLASNKLERSKIRIQRLSYVEEVEVETRPVPGTDNQVDIDVSVTERLSGSFNIGAGFSQAQGLLFNVGLTQENLLGTGQSLSVNVNTDRANTVYSVSHTEPFATVDGISRTISANYRKRDAAQEEIANYLSNSWGVNLSYGIPMSEVNTLRLGVGFNSIDLRVGSSPSLDVVEFIAKNGNAFDNFSLNASFSHDTRNRTVFATRGSAQTISSNITVPGSDLEYYKLRYDTKFYLAMTQNLTLLLHSDLAYGDGYGSTDDLPFFERYFAGGLRTVRAFNTNSLGPRDILSNDPIGGNLRVVGGADVIFPIPFMEKPPSSVRLSAFFDVGNVFLYDAPTFDSTENGFDASQLRMSTGLSFVWLAPIGPLRFSYGLPLNDVPGDDLRAFQFSIGSFF